MRRRNILVEGSQTAVCQDMEYVLLRCPKFYAEENIVTVFPVAARCAAELRAQGIMDLNYYLLYTFQPSDYVMEKLAVPALAPDELLVSYEEEEHALTSDDDGTASAIGSPAAKTHDDGFSELIQYTASSVEWKDRSRERFFEVMEDAKERVTRELATTADGVNGRAPFFMDWPDPATGLPMHSERGPSTFTDADTIQQFFSYNSVLIAGAGGGCRMIEHPRFGLNVYPAAGVVVAPRCAEEALCRAVRNLVGDAAATKTLTM